MIHLRDPRPTILYVDDSRLMRFAARRALSERYTVLLAADGYEALVILGERPEIAAVITDLRMPRCNGLDLVRRLRDDSTELGARRLPILAVSGLAQPEEFRRLRRAGANDVMTKPFTDRSLELRTDRLLSGRFGNVSHPPVVEVPLAANIERSHPRFRARLRQAISFHERHDLSLALLRVHVRNAAALDQQLGAGGRDAALRLFERIVAATVRVEDTVARTGANDITLLLPATSAVGARALRVRLRELLQDQACKVRGKNPRLDLEFFVYLPKTGKGAVPLRAEVKRAFASKAAQPMADRAHA